jgi:hypothetical protein
MSIDLYSCLATIAARLPELSSSITPLWHPLGFVSCIVEPRALDHLVRLHYWPKKDRRPKSPDWPIHTHKFDLSSLVLLGQVRDIQYRPAEGDRFGVYAVRYQGDDSTIVPTHKETSIETVVDAVRSAGESYSVPIGTFHQTVVSIDAEALTLVVCTNFSEADPLVLGSSEAGVYSYHRAEFDRAFFWARVSAAVGTFNLIAAGTASAVRP